jgi:hypothetical protein
MLARLVCLFRRHHDYRLRGASGRVFLECDHCGLRSPGWETGRFATPIQPAPPDLRLLLDDSGVVPPLTDIPRESSSRFLVGYTNEFRLHLDA